VKDSVFEALQDLEEVEYIHPLEEVSSEISSLEHGLASFQVEVEAFSSLSITSHGTS